MMSQFVPTLTTPSIALATPPLAPPPGLPLMLLFRPPLITPGTAPVMPLFAPLPRPPSMPPFVLPPTILGRSEERRVGKECVG